MADSPEPPKRRDLLRALRAAERMLRTMGSDWEDIPGSPRRQMLRLANWLQRLLTAAGAPPYPPMAPPTPPPSEPKPPTSNDE
jgi:hypothetical protein